MRGRVLFLVVGVAAGCSPSEFSAADGASGTSASGAGGTSTVSGGSGGTSEPGTGGSTAGGSSVGGGRGVVGGAGGMGAFGGKPPSGAGGGAGLELPIGTGGGGAEGGTAATGGSGAEGGATSTGGTAGDAGGTMEPGTGGASMGSGGTGGDTGSSGVPGVGGAGGAGSTGGTSGGSVGTTGGVGGAGGAGGTAGVGSGGGASGAGGSTGGSGGTGGGTMTGGTGGTTPLGGCNNELLANADFEQGKAAGWTSTSDWPGIDLIVPKTEPALMAEGVAPYAGTFLAWLGGIPDNEWDHNVTMISQYVQIPATASSLTLSGRHLVKSIDDPSDIYDVSYLEFDLNDKVVWQSLALTNQSVTNGWVAFDKTTHDLAGLAGKTLLFYAYARTDPTGKSSFFLDSLSLVATCGR